MLRICFQNPWQFASNQLTLQHQKQASMATGFTYRHYILKDHLGSWTTIADAEGNAEQELSFDAWGNLRDPETWHTSPSFTRP